MFGPMNHCSTRTTLACAILVGAFVVAAEQSEDPIRQLTTQLRSGGSFSEVKERARELLLETERLHGGDSLQSGRVIDLLVESLWRGGEAALPESLELAERAVQIKESIAGPESPEMADSLDGLASVLVERGKYADAIPLFERAVAIREQALGEWDLDLARGLNYMGWAVSQFGDVERARATYERVLRIREQVLGPSHPDVAGALNNLAIVHKNQGNYSEASRLYARALGVYESTRGPGHPDSAGTLHNLAVLLRNQGDYASSLEHFERSLALDQESLGPDHPDVATTLVNLGILRSHLGDLESALGLLNQAWRIQTARLPPDHPSIATTLDNLATVHFRLEDYERALAIQTEVLRIREQAFAPDHPLIANTLHNLGAAYEELGDLERARPALERALAIRTEVHGAAHPLAAGTLANLADLWRDAGQPERAAAMYERVLAIREERLGADHPTVAVTLRYRAETLIELGQAQRAFESTLQAAEIGREHLRLTARTLSHDEALSYSSVRPRGEDLALSLLLQHEVETTAAVNRTWDGLIRSRGLVLDEMRSRRAVSGQAVLTRELRRASTRLGNLLVRGPEGSGTRYPDYLREARQERDAAERALARASVDFRLQQEAARVGLAEVTAALPAETALVAYVRYVHREIEERTLSPQKEPAYAAWVARAGAGGPVAIDLGPAERIEELVRNWRDAVESARGRLPRLQRAAESSYRQAGAELRRAIWDPVSAAVGPARRAFVVPDGVLHAVSLATLPTGEGQYLIETGPQVHYLGAERDLATIPRAKNGNGSGLLALGGPDFDHSEGRAASKDAASPPAGGEDCVDPATLGFTPLHGARREVEEVVSIWRRQEGAGAHVEERYGARATEEAFKATAPGRRILHLATHGFFIDNLCAAPTDAVGRLTADIVAAGSRRWTLSGLALAGSNVLPRLSPAGAEDGILTAEEIATLNLGAAEWAVLSGCDTGGGQPVGGEGILGLRRSFEIAGVDTIIMSLWPVEDAAARAWMRSLYAARLGGLSTAEAVRQAGLDALQRRRQRSGSTHPYYWGAFVAVGAWR